MLRRHLLLVAAVTFLISGCGSPTCEIIVDNQSGQAVELFEASDKFGNSLVVTSIPDGVSNQFEKLLIIARDKPLVFKVVFADNSEVESFSPSGNTHQVKYRFTIQENGIVYSVSTSR